MNEEEDIRLEEFRQFKKEIRGSREYLIVGIDVAKEKHHAFFGTATGKTLLRRLIFDNTIEGFEKLLTQVRAIQVAQGLPKVVFGLEPTANYHKPLGEHLIKCGREGRPGFRGSGQAQPGASGWALGQTRHQRLG